MKKIIDWFKKLFHVEIKQDEQDNTQEESQEKPQEKKPFKIHMPDELQMFFGADFIINNYIAVRQPTIGDIIEYGEQEYYSMVYTLCAIPFDMKQPLWDDLGINYMEISEFEMFALFCRRYTPKETSILLGDLDFSKFEVLVEEPKPEDFVEGQEPKLSIILQNPINGQIIDESMYMLMVQYIRKLHNINPYLKYRKAGNKTTFHMLVDMDREERETNKNKPYKSMLKNLISTMLVYNGFKYKKNELKECGMYEFMDAIQRAQVFVSTDALLHGMYSGFVDTKGISKDELNWFRDVSEKH